MPEPPEMSVVICSLNGAPGVERCLRALRAQTIASALEVVVVDDGSTDATSAVASRLGARVIRHHVNRGLATARNSGILATRAPVVAFLDDDCVPEPDWAERILSVYRTADLGGMGAVAGVGGTVEPRSAGGVVGSYLKRHNPLGPMESELGRNERLPYRLWLYLKRQWVTRDAAGLRPVYALVGANMSFRRQALSDVGGFDSRFSFGAEELDLARRLQRRDPRLRLLLDPSARVAHDFEPTLRDALRRSRAYGRGSARMFVKWPSQGPTFFPMPVLVLLLACAGRTRRSLLAAALAPFSTCPTAVVQAVRSRRAAILLDAYIQLAQESAENVGFISGWRSFRAIRWDDEQPPPASPYPLDELRAAA
jgi:glycosyltransferase involved in cell wall biosynthesis